jgi:hypothetical protein
MLGESKAQIWMRSSRKEVLCTSGGRGDYFVSAIPSSPQQKSALFLHLCSTAPRWCLLFWEQMPALPLVRQRIVVHYPSDFWRLLLPAFLA